MAPRLLPGATVATLSILLGLGAAAPGAVAKTRPVAVLPFQAAAPAEADPWLGDGIAETLVLATQTTTVLLPIDRARVAQAARAGGGEGQPPGDRAVLALGRALHAELVFFGDYQRTPDGGVTITPRLIDTRGGEAQTLPPISGAEGRVLEAVAEVGPAYARALKLGLKPDELQRMGAVARPTSNLTAFEAYAKGRRAALAGTQQGQEGAAELLARAVEVDPTFGLAHFALGQTHLALGNRWKASAQFRAATQVDPNLPEPYKMLGDLFMSSPRRLYDQAIEAYQKATALRPHYAEAHVGLGDARAAKNDYEGAIAQYQKALQFDPLNARVQLSLAKIYYGEKNLYYEAVNAYRKAIELDGQLLDARMGLGEMFEEKGLYKDAIVEYRKVIEIDGKHTAAHYNLALAYEKVDVKESVAAWERYIALASQIASEKEWVDVARQHLRKMKDKAQ